MKSATILRLGMYPKTGTEAGLIEEGGSEVFLGGEKTETLSPPFLRFFKHLRHDTWYLLIAKSIFQRCASSWKKYIGSSWSATEISNRKGATWCRDAAAAIQIGIDRFLGLWRCCLWFGLRYEFSCRTRRGRAHIQLGTGGRSGTRREGETKPVRWFLICRQLAAGGRVMISWIFGCWFLLMCEGVMLLAGSFRIGGWRRTVSLTVLTYFLLSDQIDRRTW